MRCMCIFGIMILMIIMGIIVGNEKVHVYDGHNNNSMVMQMKIMFIILGTDKVHVYNRYNNFNVDDSNNNNNVTIIIKTKTFFSFM